MSALRLGDRQLHLGYGTNVHRLEDLDELAAVLDGTVARVKARFAPDRPLGLNLCLGRTVAARLAADPAALRELRRSIERAGAYVFSINAFPLHDFHAPVIKEAVYRPDWREAERESRTIELARLLAGLLPEGLTGSLSAPSGTWKAWGRDASTHWTMAGRIGAVVAELARLEFATGRRIVLGLEPEPLTTGETTEEFITYWREFLLPAATAAAGAATASAGGVAPERHLGVNLDLAHQACEFEDLPGAMLALRSAGIPLAGVHVAAALHLDRPADSPAGLAALRRFDEPRYLHQVLGCDAKGRVVLRLPDLGRLFELSAAELGRLAAVRVHFHVPLFVELDAAPADRERFGGLRSTARETRAALAALASGGGLTEHLVVETYTWRLLADRAPLPGVDRELEENLARELAWTTAALAGGG